jgi:DNA-directed RNA polymerase specialized sigma subunit
MATQPISVFRQINGLTAVPTLRRSRTSQPSRKDLTVRPKELRMEKRTQEEEKLIMDLLPLVKHVAFKIREHLPVHVEVDDLIGNGVLGLLDATGKFDPSKRVKLESYARHRIRGAILDGLRG